MANNHQNNSTLALGAAIAVVGVGVGAGAVGYLLGSKESKKQEIVSIAAIPEHKLLSRSRFSSVCDAEDVKISDKRSLVDVRIDKIRPLVPPVCLLEEIPLTHKAAAVVNSGRQGVQNILHGIDDRLVVIVGPCSIHDVDAALEYATKLKDIRDELSMDLHIIMRVYFEKPRTTVGWKGLINDPDLDGTFNINKGLRVARSLLCSINEMGLPAGCEFLDTISPQFTADLVSWGAIGARTTECQLHRELSSGLSMPIGFKNGTGGSLQLAVDACVSSSNPHCFLSVSSQGLAAIVNTRGNDCCHIILRGGSTGPNYEKEYIDEASVLMKKAKIDDNILVDCSHGNSKKIHTNQPLVADDLAKQISTGDKRIVGVMLESNLVEGNQKLIAGKKLEFGKSITDACMGWDTTVEVLKNLASAVRKRREVNNA